ncbi:MAG TPA: hypothetical protein VEW48_23835 [Thermoanaerobaculia bacterium]|nr:hypothetical protein [Thermoanaerobaculia bacterium]
MPLAEALQVTLEVVRVLETLEIPYLLGGSLTSSLHGIPRTTQDADLVADLQLSHVAPLVERLSGAFYIDDKRARDAIRRRASFNLIHLATMTKVDIFILKDDPLARREMERRQWIALPGGEGASLWVATAEDIVIQKLAWFVLGGEESERQWNDVQGVLKVQRGKLDLEDLRRSAAEAGVEDLLERALSEAGGS